MNTFEFQATGIGSLGHVNYQEAVSFVLDLFPEIPFWVQLPQRCFRENMYVQFSEGIPGIVVKEEERKVYVDTRKITEEDLSNIYEHYLGGKNDFFGISKEYAEGFYEFIEQLRAKKISCSFLKGQIIGPISFMLTVTDDSKKPLIYQEQIADSILKILTMKARWQVRRLKEIAQRVIIFVDEPYLVSLGSGYVNLDFRDVLKNLDEMIEGIRQENALVGIHCCGNTDWGLLTQTKTDIISFDAYNFSESILVYSEAINIFMKRGGVIAWGIVPTDSDVEKLSSKELFKKFMETVEILVSKGLNRELIYKQSIITPGCGLGSFSSEKGEVVLRATCELSRKLRKELFFR
ncbi:MAG: hypothetical protein NC818_00380 [Candidatus Omnitrophica bacterium]|nr:hypothetical protein [Candidatus Omnitrophota bacterium]